MTSPAQATSPLAEVIDLDSLLAPIAGENPAGESLQYSGLHDDLRDARRADENLEQGEWKRELKIADFAKVIAVATDALATRTKDLQVSAWLSEALTKEHGFAGLRDSLRLMRGLHEHFWESLYPEIDEGDLEARANALYWMDGQLAMAIKGIPLTRSMLGLDYNYLQWEEAKQFDAPENFDQSSSADIERAEQLRARAAEEGKVTGEEWRKAKNATRRAFYEELFALVTECWNEFLALERVVDEKFERQSPSLNQLKKTIDDIRALAEKLVKEKRLLEPDEAGEQERAIEGEALPEEGASAIGGSLSSGPVKSRQEALRRLAEVADYFQKTEPHSPVAYLVQRAIRWGQMPLDVWLEDVIKDAAVLAALRETLGIRSSPEGGEGGNWQ